MGSGCGSHRRRLGRSIDLDPVELESLTWQSHDLFSEFLATPFGPEDDPDDGLVDDGHDDR